MVDTGTLATLLVAAATLVLAMVTYSNVQQNKRQVKILTKQSLTLRSQQDPIPVINSLSFDGNALKITVENSGNGPASSLAIGTDFLLARRELFSDRDGTKPVSSDDFQKSIDGKIQVFARYELETKKELKVNGKRMYPVELACQLVNEGKNSTILLPNASYAYSLDLSFGLGEKRGDPSMFPHFDNLVDELKGNGFRCISVSLDLIGKNMSDDPIQRQGIATFMVDFSLHKNLEEAFAMKTRPYFTPLDWMEIARMIPLSREMYLRSKSPVNYAKNYEEDKI
jgi:hypothetical protein